MSPAAAAHYLVQTPLRGEDGDVPIIAGARTARHRLSACPAGADLQRGVRRLAFRPTLCSTRHDGGKSTKALALLCMSSGPCAPPPISRARYTRPRRPWFAWRRPHACQLWPQLSRRAAGRTNDAPARTQAIRNAGAEGAVREALRCTQGALLTRRGDYGICCTKFSGFWGSDVIPVPKIRR